VGFKRLIVAAKKAEADKNKKRVPENWEEFELTEKSLQTPKIASFIFQKPGEGSQISPGSFIRLKLPNGLVRSYSIVSGTTHRFQLGIALKNNSRGGSRYLHQTLNQGDKILAGRITEGVPIPEGASNHIFIAGGIGITAFLMHTDIYTQINYNYTIHYAVRSVEDIPFRDLIEKMGQNVIIYDSSKGQRLDIPSILKTRVWNSYIYACGPKRMLDDLTRSSIELGVSQDEIHYEAFQTDAPGEPFTVQLKSSKTVLRVEGENTLLQTLKEAGLDVDSSCEVGNCGTCRVEVCEGKVEHRGSGLSEDEKHKAMLSCVSRGVGHLIIDF
jgi:ferredoxin-NADP reductase